MSNDLLADDAVPMPSLGQDSLRESDKALLSGYETLLLDLDGVCYLGGDPISAAPPTLRAARDQHRRIRFITNNASRTPDDVAALLRRMQIEADADEVITSATCAAAMLAGELAAGSPVLVVGGDGVEHALRAVGLQPVTSADAEPVAVLQGWDRGVGWPSLAEAALAIAAGAEWVATNLDATIPTERGVLPGNGALVAALSAATGKQPRSVGKPEPAMYVAAAADGGSPLAVGDRLDTDIAGAVRAGLPSLLVLSGVSRPLDLVHAPRGSRPTHLGRDLSALTRAAPAISQVGDAQWRCGAMTAVAEGSKVTVRQGVSNDGSRGTGVGGLTPTGQPLEDTDGLDALRVACVAAWFLIDGGHDQDNLIVDGLDF